MSETIRINKHLAHTTGLSRREIDEKIKQGRITINGITATLGNAVDPKNDVIVMDDTGITKIPQSYTYLLVNKPVGYVCSRRQQDESPTIYQLLPIKYQSLKVAGRLDKDSCGLVLLTDDGDTIFQLTHPKFSKEKTYLVSLNKPLSSNDKSAIESGVTLEDGISSLKISEVTGDKSGLPPNTYVITMKEGRNRQIRRTFTQLHYTVMHLKRIAFGPYALDILESGQYLQIN